MPVPQYINVREVALQKPSAAEGMKLVAWDCITPCSANCPLRSQCSYLSRAKATGKCELQGDYLQTFVDMIMTKYKYLDEADLYVVGMHILPLYGQLARQKIVEKSLDEITYIDNKGKVVVHPILAEIRSTLMLITKLWKDIGFSRPPVGPPGAGGGSEFGKETGSAGFGDPAHFHNISQNADNKKGVIR